ncbi:MAG: class I mannose-6-phosphate isomerase [Leptolyngbyaceae cyanobacterium]
MNWYPLKFTTHIRHYYFGERQIPERLKKQGLPQGPIAETWEISDYRHTTGTVTNGALAGRTLHDLTMSYPNQLVGVGWRGPHFPLLEKFLDASHRLPIHLHANDETAARVYQEPNGKTEAWYIVWAAPGATVLAGLKGGFSRQQLFDAFVAQDYDAVMVRHPIQAGDTIYVPGGILHSFGPDCLVFEVQQTSDLGQMVMPFDLYGNSYSQAQWHANINATLDELSNHYQPRPTPGLVLQSGGNRRTIGGAGPYFALEYWELGEPYTEPSHPHRCITLTNVGAPIQIKFAGASESLNQAESCLLPAAIGEVRIIPDPQAKLLVCYVPDLATDIVAPLRSAGYRDRQIQALGELPQLQP